MSVATPAAPAVDPVAPKPTAFQQSMAAASTRATQAEEASEEIEGDDDASQPSGESDPPKPSDDNPPEPADSALADPTKSPAPTLPTTPAGPTREWVEFAMQKGVPRDLIRTARDDAQLQEFVAMWGDEPEPETAPATLAASLKFEIGDDDFDATDPVHRQLKAMHDAQVQVVSRLEQELAEVKGKTSHFEQIERQRALLQVENDYDAGLDALNIPELGAPGSEPRKVAYPIYDFLLRANPKMDRAEAARRAAFATHPDLVAKQATAAQLAALANQQQETLGGGPAKPPAKKQPTSTQTFRELLREKSRKAREAGYL